MARSESRFLESDVQKQDGLGVSHTAICIALRGVVGLIKASGLETGGTIQMEQAKDD